MPLMSTFNATPSVEIIYEDAFEYVVELQAERDKVIKANTYGNMYGDLRQEIKERSKRLACKMTRSCPLVRSTLLVQSPLTRLDPYTNRCLSDDELYELERIQDPVEGTFIGYTPMRNEMAGTELALPALAVVLLKTVHLGNHRIGDVKAYTPIAGANIDQM
jgi:hypothetical protein